MLCHCQRSHGATVSRRPRLHHGLHDLAREQLVVSNPVGQDHPVLGSRGLLDIKEDGHMVGEATIGRAGPASPRHKRPSRTAEGLEVASSGQHHVGVDPVQPRQNCPGPARVVVLGHLQEPGEDPAKDLRQVTPPGMEAPSLLHVGSLLNALGEVEVTDEEASSPSGRPDAACNPAHQPH
eukprot:3090948-Lingulodinium_polyedra.AAC.1